jgi:hypothetical protein
MEYPRLGLIRIESFRSITFSLTLTRRCVEHHLVLSHGLETSTFFQV